MGVYLMVNSIGNGFNEGTGKGRNMTSRYLDLLSDKFDSEEKVATEIINLEAILDLPKGTEHFMSDIHGEYESFLHILKNASGVIKDKITQIYGRTLSERDRQVLATLIYYPEQKLEYIKDEVDDINDWYKITLYHLIKKLTFISKKNKTTNGLISLIYFW